jgi:hypothetical protein
LHIRPQCATQQLENRLQNVHCAVLCVALTTITSVPGASKQRDHQVACLLSQGVGSQTESRSKMYASEPILTKRLSSG